jgi:hypothetical protein
MFLLPLTMIAVVCVAVYTVMHRRTRPATVTAHAPADAAAHSAPFWPITTEGKLGIAAFALSFVPVVLVNVIQVPYLAIVMVVASLALTGTARFARHDRSTSVLVALAVSVVATLAWVLFLMGEVMIGHD